MIIGTMILQNSTGEPLKSEEEEIVITFVDGDEPVEYIELDDYTAFEDVTFVDNGNVLIESNSNVTLHPVQQSRILSELKEEEENYLLAEQELYEEEDSPLNVTHLSKTRSRIKKGVTEDKNREGYEDALCAICGKLVKAKTISRHISNHSTHFCEHCSTTFKTSEELEKHKEVHLDNEYPCPLCDQSFKTATEYAIHSFKHVQVYPCPLCNFTTKAKGSICGHIKRHEGQYKYRCTICGKGFIGKALLATHEEIHLDIKQYTCDLCGKKFSVRRYLDVHRQLNHKKELYGIEELFQCEVGYNFKCLN
ncbi:hypothetical protein NQ318_020884 [Aromia moschata]|uniref:C2H2-type domain-containing protein n=1 Tax=Aromia moschata TaxID=1265417 RepID=A0AAV8XZ97_9CUCU|nr:hypothetical protein NQ318_020884 [Aromia moschata]